jgi:uncharacterized protein YndB with AHSA1/START domain
MELILRREFPYPASLLWTAFTDPDALTAWFWPVRASTVVDLDVRPGGRYRIDGPGLGIAVSGTHQTVTAERLGFTWQWDGEDLVTAVTIDLSPFTLTHAGFLDEATRDDHVAGWSDCLDRLSGWLEAGSGAR